MERMLLQYYYGEKKHVYRSKIELSMSGNKVRILKEKKTKKGLGKVKKLKDR